MSILNYANDTSGAELNWNTLTKAALIFIVLSATYFFARSPGLDDYDSVQFAMGVRSFDVWQHQPHPPGYPLSLFRIEKPAGEVSP